MIDDIRFEDTTPLQTQLYQHLSQRIVHRRYLPGSQLPSSRQLAADLGISRNTVNAVYDQLKAEGFSPREIGANKYGLHQVVYGSFETREEALAKLREIKKSNNPGAWLLVKEL